MAESSLSLTFDDLRGEVGQFLGYGRGTALGDSAWTRQQQAAIDSCVKSGLRSFYYPPPAEGQEGTYDWSFLRPVVSLGIAVGATSLPLPDDFGGFEGEITVSSAQTTAAWPIQLTGEGLIRQRYADTPSATGWPVAAALGPLRGTTATQGQRFQLTIWPAADRAYTLSFEYYVSADYLSSAFPYHLGGMAHSETILESCLAVAEQRLDDAATVHSMKFRERLRASIGLDRRMKPAILGYNGDRSDRRSGVNPNRHGDQSVTVNGTLY